MQAEAQRIKDEEEKKIREDDLKLKEEKIRLEYLEKQRIRLERQKIKEEEEKIKNIEKEKLEEERRIARDEKQRLKDIQIAKQLEEQHRLDEEERKLKYQEQKLKEAAERIKDIEAQRLREIEIQKLKEVEELRRKEEEFRLKEKKEIEELRALRQKEEDHKKRQIEIKKREEEIRLREIEEQRARDARIAEEKRIEEENIDALFFGAIDMAPELRCDLSWENLLYARSRVVHAAASAGLDVIDVPHLDLDDMEGMRIAAEQARALGFAGKGSIHPKQIPILNEVFTPSPEKIARARRVIAEFEAADTGLVVIDGKLIEKPALREMYRIVAIADRMGL